jgi:hypothetical protein
MLNDPQNETKSFTYFYRRPELSIEHRAFAIWHWGRQHSGAVGISHAVFKENRINFIYDTQ